MTQDAEKDYERYKQLVDLWAKENPIKTNKLQVLLLVNSILLTATNMSGGFVAKNWPIYLGGFIFSLIWVLSIGRTSLFQEIWQIKIGDLAKEYPNDRRFQTLRNEEYKKRASKLLQYVGFMPSKYYIIGAPISFCLIWLAVFLYFIQQ
jgi:hypothetical protein